MMLPSFSRSAGSLFLLWLASPAAAQKYNLVENWHGENFLDAFKFYVGADPTNGYVNYVHPDQAERDGLFKVTDSGAIYLGVDHKNTLDPHGKGRDSVRLGSMKYYDRSLVIADIAHMPGSVCGTWPAFWSVGKSWPEDGEIDILEGVNLQDHNEVVMHTSGTCSLQHEGMSGAINATGCGTELGPVGCVIEGEKGSYGTSFNKQGGGVYALEWTEEHLKIWFFPRHSIPPSITSGHPDVNKFGTPMALVKEGCDVANVFKPQSFIFDTTFCGDWAGGVFGKSGCPMTDADSFQSCHNFVAHHPEQFKETYWEINSLKIYQTGVKGIEVSASESTTQAPATQQSTPEPPIQKSTTHESVDQGTTVQKTTTQEITQHVTPTVVVTEAPADVHPSMIVVPVTGSSSAPAQPWAVDSVPPGGAFPGPSTGAGDQPAATSVPDKPKASTTRYVTQYVTATSTVCTATDSFPSTSPHDGSAPWIASWFSGHSSPSASPVSAGTAATAPAEPSPSMEPPTSWGSGPAEGIVAHQSVEDAAPAFRPAPSNVDAAQAAKSVTVASNMVNDPAPVQSSAMHSAAVAQSTPVSRRPISSASHMPVVKPSQHSTPVIPKPTGSSAPSSSASHGLPSGNGPVFTGAANQLSARLPALIAMFAVVLLA
ncbi:hypothetical protein N7492_003162 [Penicillium capsulatum]|uniref:endo-1,3(4)-beta-glucanase n=1 Tax=Penicillium capsulatum TaxID=69766 RepID=A0A9W9ILH0_9EURO|nr:hypothetical protein N7492_003162 [Penicillium capsulatum]KAJ6122248.1 hypothetical protein N7512_004713 [Penicillium capsulatum]